MDTDLISILTLIISTLTLVATIYSVFLSKYTYKQTFLIPKKSEALQNLITLISNKINEIKVEDEISEDNTYRLEYVLYIDQRKEGCPEIFDKWKQKLLEFKYSENYKYLIDSAKNEFDELLLENFYNTPMSRKDLVIMLENKKSKLLKLYDKNFK